MQQTQLGGVGVHCKCIGVWLFSLSNNAKPSNSAEFLCTKHAVSLLCLLNIESLSAIQTIKYWLSAKNQSAIKNFQKEDYMYKAVDSKLVKNMNEVAKAMKEANQEELNKKNVSMTSLGITPPPVISKKKSLKHLTEESEKHRKPCQKNIAY